MYLSTEQLTFSSLNRPVTRHKVRSILEKGSGELNEDVLLEEGYLLGVFDGATSLDKRRFQYNLTGGFLAAKTAAQSFQGNLCSLENPGYLPVYQGYGVLRNRFNFTPEAAPKMTICVSRKRMRLIAVMFFQFSHTFY